MIRLGNEGRGEMLTKATAGCRSDKVKIAFAIVLVTVSLLPAGCGSASKSRDDYLSFGPGTTTTLRGVRTGTMIRCRRIASAPVPAPGKLITIVTQHRASGYIQVKHMTNGSVRVICFGLGG